MKMSKHLDNKNLAVWRQKHFAELEVCMTVAKAIRDDPEAGAKNRIEAVKVISRLLSALQPEKGESAGKLIPAASKVELDPEHKKRLGAILDKLG